MKLTTASKADRVHGSIGRWMRMSPKDMTCAIVSRARKVPGSLGPWMRRTTSRVIVTSRRRMIPPSIGLTLVHGKRRAQQAQASLVRSRLQYKVPAGKSMRRVPMCQMSLLQLHARARRAGSGASSPPRPSAWSGATSTATRATTMSGARRCGAPAVSMKLLWYATRRLQNLKHGSRVQSSRITSWSQIGERQSPVWKSH
mmetsp:Transcript_17470/g.32980  ORF Transcript_17470/g.32980 Transcript_17470/m.32980 type:complete len:200 (+) Transcript_17470:140-739(+)